MDVTFDKDEMKQIVQLSIEILGSIKEHEEYKFESKLDEEFFLRAIGLAVSATIKEVDMELPATRFFDKFIKPLYKIVRAIDKDDIQRLFDEGVFVDDVGPEELLTSILGLQIVRMIQVIKKSELSPEAIQEIFGKPVDAEVH